MVGAMSSLHQNHFGHTSPDGCESPYKRLGTRFCVHIVFVASAASKNVNEKIKTQTSSPPFAGGYMGPGIEIPICESTWLVIIFAPASRAMANNKEVTPLLTSSPNSQSARGKKKTRMPFH